MTCGDRDSVRRFAELVEQEDLYGLAFQHLSLCRRRAWFHLNRIDYAHLDDRMAKGEALHDSSRVRDSSVEGLMGLSPDRIDWQRRVVHEGKGSAGAVEAVSRQTAFYALMLWAADGRPWSAMTDILPSKRSRLVPIDAEDLQQLKRESVPPKADRKPICAACSYRFLCGHT
jgi:CRISPR-associated exonuclease Cas4